jgi:hypothetical protein
MATFRSPFLLLLTTGARSSGGLRPLVVLGPLLRFAR